MLPETFEQKLIELFKKNNKKIVEIHHEPYGAKSRYSIIYDEE